MSLALGRQQRTLPTALLSAYRSPSVLQTATVSLSVGPNERRQQSTRTAASRQQSQPSVSRQVGKSRTYSNSMPLKQQSDVDVAAATPSTTTVASPYVLTTALTAFSLITWDVFQGPHWLVSHLDEPAQHWVFTSLSFETRQLAGSWVLSNSFIATGVLGWWAAGVTLIAQSGRKGLYLLSTAIAAYLLGGGFLLSGDVLLVDFIKHIFQRARPSTLHKTFSFPSGHTTAGVFIVGVLLFVLLPLILRPQIRAARSANDKSVTSRDTLYKFAELTAKGRYPLWLVAGATTAAGRVIADVHWVTDTLAGASLGIALVSITAMVSNKRT